MTNSKAARDRQQVSTKYLKQKTDGLSTGRTGLCRLLRSAVKLNNTFKAVAFICEFQTKYTRIMIFKTIDDFHSAFNVAVWWVIVELYFAPKLRTDLSPLTHKPTDRMCILLNSWQKSCLCTQQIKLPIRVNLYKKFQQQLKRG
jgi:hypothetical protein